MILLGRADTAADVKLWRDANIKACGGLDLDYDGSAYDIGAIIDVSREPSVLVWDHVIETFNPIWMFGPVCHDAGELGAYMARVEIHAAHRGIQPVHRAGSDLALEALACSGRNEIALDCGQGPWSWNHRLLKNTDVWIAGAPTPRDQWLLWLELRHRGVTVKGIILDSPSKYQSHRLSPSNLAPIPQGKTGPSRARANARVMAAFWEATTPIHKSRRRLRGLG